jgi:hypothetical protein
MDRSTPPTWLQSSAQDLNAMAFPLEELLEGSAYYPACFFDGAPVKHLGHLFWSYVYVDSGVTSQRLDDALETSGFLGYRVLVNRPLGPNDLAPKGWRARAEPRGGNRFQIDPRESFARWLMFDRQPDFSEEHGPQRFSIVYVAADGAAAYEAMFIGNGLLPRCLLIINPGIGFGGNQDNYFREGNVLHRSLLRHPRGLPEFLVSPQNAMNGWAGRPVASFPPTLPEGATWYWAFMRRRTP